jgi:hypothetical protein
MQMLFAFVKSPTSRRKSTPLAAHKFAVTAKSHFADQRLFDSSGSIPGACLVTWLKLRPNLKTIVMIFPGQRRGSWALEWSQWHALIWLGIFDQAMVRPGLSLVEICPETTGQFILQKRLGPESELATSGILLRGIGQKVPGRAENLVLYRDPAPAM